MRGKWSVYGKAALVCVAAFLANMLLARFLLPFIRDATLRWAAALSLVQVLAVAVIAAYLVSRRLYHRFEKNLHHQIRPAIEERVMALALDGEVWSTSVPSRGPARRVLENCLAHALAAFKETSRDRVARFALEHSFVAQWERTARLSKNVEARGRALFLLGLVSRLAGDAVICDALSDSSPAIRTAAADALLVNGEPDAINRVFRCALGESLLTRSLLAGDLKRYARHLLATTVPALLAETANPDTIRCLEIVATWKLAMPGIDIAPLLAVHGGKPVLPLVVALLPYVEVNDEIENYLLSAIDDADQQVQCAAARAIGELKLSRMIPALARALNQSSVLALVAAQSLARMGEPGTHQLAATISGPDRRAAAVALEALEHASVAATIGSCQPNLEKSANLEKSGR